VHRRAAAASSDRVEANLRSARRQTVETSSTRVDLSFCPQSDARLNSTWRSLLTPRGSHCPQPRRQTDGALLLPTTSNNNITITTPTDHDDRQKRAAPSSSGNSGISSGHGWWRRLRSLPDRKQCRWSRIDCWMDTLPLVLSNQQLADACRFLYL